MASVSNIDLYNALHGHKYFREKKLNERLIDFIAKTLELGLPYEESVTYRRQKGFKKDSKDFMASLYRLHDVGFLEDETIEDIFLFMDFSNLRELADVYNSSAKYIDPYRLPIEYVKGPNEGLLKVQALSFEDDEMNLKLYKQLNVFFQKYIFGSSSTLNYPVAMTHEVTHTQLESNKGIIRDFYNGEVISIFNELLHAYNKSEELFLRMIAGRITNISIECLRAYIPSTDSFHRATAFKYVYSTLKAFELLELYINGNSGIKREIISSIQSNFDGDNLVEDTLSRFDITTRSCTSINKVKRLIR